MSFGFYDKDWIDPPDEPLHRARCRDCNCFKNTCDVDADGSICDDFDAETDCSEEDYGVDLARDRALEGWD